MQYLFYSGPVKVCKYDGKLQYTNKVISILDSIIKITSDKKTSNQMDYSVCDHFILPTTNGEHLIELFDNKNKNRIIVKFDSEEEKNKFVKVCKDNSIIYMINEWDESVYFSGWLMFGCSYIFLIVIESMIEFRKSSAVSQKEKKPLTRFQTALCMISKDEENEVPFALKIDSIVVDTLFTFGTEGPQQIEDICRATNESCMDTFAEPYSFPCNHQGSDSELVVHISKGIKLPGNAAFQFQHVRGVKADGMKLSITFKEEDHVASDRRTLTVTMPSVREPAIVKALIINGGNALHQAWNMLLVILREKPWFRENTSRQQSEKELQKNTTEYNFLLRTSKRFQFHFALTVYSKKYGCCTWKVTNCWIMYRISRCTYESIDQILETYSKQPLLSDGGSEYYITMPREQQ